MSGSNVIKRHGRPRLGSKGQMTVELAVVFPVALVIVYIMVNVMMFLCYCARFDPLAAEAVRTQATTPSTANYAEGSRVGAVESVLASNFNDSFAQERVQVSVSMSPVGYGSSAGSEGLYFSLLPSQERYTCTLHFYPWGMPRSIFGVELSPVTHEVQFVIDPYRPGIVF